MDFTVSTYRKLLDTLQRQGFSFHSFFESLKSSEKKDIILRHDVDLLPLNSLRFAKLEAEKGIKGTYYFRIVPESFDEKIIKEIHLLGHEIGYHYEDVSLAAKRQKTKVKRQKAREGHRTYDAGRTEEGIVKIAIDSFAENLETLSKIAPIKTICMHGNPMSKWDSRLLWKYYDYHDFGIVGEPYFDINFDEVLYLTDTGRRWDGDLYNIRDKVSGVRRQAEGEKDEETKRRRDEVMKRRSDEETKRRRDEVMKRRSDEETKRRSDEVMKRRSDDETKRRRDDEIRKDITKSLSPLVPQSLSPLVPQSLSPSVPQSLSPSVSQSLSPSLQPSALSPQPSSPLHHNTVIPSHRRTIEPLHHFHSTFDIIHAAEAGNLPDKIMMTFHPQRWTDKPVPWMKELIWQNTKNAAKYFLIKLRS